MRRRIIIYTCAVALMLVTASYGAEAADRKEVVSGDPSASSSKTLGTQKSADPQIGEQAVQAIPLVAVPQRAKATGAEISELLPKEAFRQTLERISSELDRPLQEVESRLAKTREVLAGRPNVRTLRVLEAKLRDMQKRLRSWEEELDSQLAELRAALEWIDTNAAVWKATAGLARREGVSETTVTRIAAVRSDIDKARSTVVKQLDQVLAVRDRIVDPSNALTVSLGQVLNAGEARLQEVFRANRPPLWSPKVRRALREELKADRQQQFLQGFQATGQYAREQVRTFGFQIVLFVALVLLLRTLRDRTRARAEDDYDLRDAKEVFEFPWAMALLIALILTTPLHPGAPRGTGLAPAILSVVAASFIGRRFLLPAMAFVVWGIMIFYMVDRARSLLNATPTLERVVFLVEMVGALSFLFWILRPSRIAEIPPQLRRACLSLIHI